MNRPSNSRDSRVCVSVLLNSGPYLQIRPGAQILENSYVLAEVPKPGKREEFSVRPKISTKRFPAFYGEILSCGSFADCDRDLQLTCAGLAFPRARIDLSASEYVFTQIFDAPDNKE
jgi:hypothetical protein